MHTDSCFILFRIAIIPGIVVCQYNYYASYNTVPLMFLQKKVCNVNITKVDKKDYTLQKI